MRPTFIHTAIRTLILIGTIGLFCSNATAQKRSYEDADFENLFLRTTQYRHENKIDLALEALNQAAALSEEQENEKILADSYHMFAILYMDMNKRETTEFYWDRAKVLLKNLAYPYGTAVHKYIEAKLLYNSKNNFQAIYMLNEAKTLSNDRNLRNNILLLEAHIYASIEKYDSAITNYNALLVNTDAFEQDYIVTKANEGLANLFANREMHQESIKYANDALAIAEKNKYSKEILALNELLGSAYENAAQYNLSLKHNRKLMVIKDSVFTIEKLKAEAKTADRIRFDFMHDQIKDQTKEIEELNESASRSEITAILTSAFLTIISLLAVSLFRNNQIKLKTNDLLQTKNKELQAARDAAVQAMEAKTNFLSTVSHELRTPLYAVTGLTHILLEESPADHQKEHLKSLKFSGDYLLNFINDILQINKIDAEKLEPLAIEFSLKKVLTDVITGLQQNAKQNNTQLLLDYDENIPKHLLSDPIKLSQIFLNLVGNAIKFTHDGYVKIIAKQLRNENGEANIYFEVQDNGIGIADAKQKNIFDSFDQGSVRINREYGGTGLGLSIVKSLLGLFNSDIALDSEEGKGSAFYFEINMKVREVQPEEILFEPEHKEYDLDGLHLLVVEDNKINQVITKKMLSKRGITCDIANNGYEAVDLAKANTYDGILMDIHLPGISGVEATIQIRQFDSVIPIVALTAISLDDSVETFYNAGCNDVVTKPFKPELFYQKVGENILEPKLKRSVS
ncbi:MAG: ATP-binding protein [Flavobacteriaceae bacterium]|nr:ATP-binding protein [Flavobacteriaceae bacterium]